MDLIYPEESFAVIGICMAIHNSLGMGFKEINYKDALEIEFKEKLIPYCREKRFTLKYKTVVLRNPYVADFIVFDKIVLEIKSTTSIHDAHKAQALSYLAVTGFKLALIINFGERSLAYKRILL